MLNLSHQLPLQKNFFLLALFCVFQSTFTDLARATDDQAWSSLSFSSAYSEKSNLLGELLNRYSIDEEKFVTRSVRAGIGYKIGSSWTYSLIFENRTAGSDKNDENRYIHQWTRRWNFECIDLSTRFRFELREFSDTSAFSNRARTLVKADFKYWSYNKITPFAYSEYFHTLNSIRGRPNGAYEFRNSIGLTLPINDNLKKELGFIKRFMTTPRSGRDSTDHFNVYSANFRWAYN